MCVFIMRNMDGWDEHEVTFAPAEGLEQNETSVRVLDHELDDAQRRGQAENRHDMLNAAETVQQVMERQELTNEMKKDPGYKFLMMVAAFSSRRLDKITVMDGQASGIAAPACGRTNDVWLHAPEVTGVVQLSASIYGHIKEAERIVRNGWSLVPLKILVEHADVAPLFARLVAIRLALSDCMSSAVQTFDNNFKRLHQEQSMVLKSIRCAAPVAREHDWTRPLNSCSALGL